VGAVGLLYPWGRETKKAAEHLKPVVDDVSNPIVKPKPKPKAVTTSVPRETRKPRPSPKRKPEPIPDTTFVYQLPFRKDFGYRVSQGFFGEDTHSGIHALDIVMEEGDPILASRGGLVFSSVDTTIYGPMGRHIAKYKDRHNGITIRHDDGTYASYGHILYGSSEVEKGDSVQVGDRIARCGMSNGAHLHFQVNLPNGATYPYVFATSKKPHGEVLEKGAYYMPHGSSRPFPVNGIDSLYTSDVQQKKTRQFHSSQPIRVVARFTVPVSSVKFKFRRPNHLPPLLRIAKVLEGHRTAWLDLPAQETAYARDEWWQVLAMVNGSPSDSTRFYVYTKSLGSPIAD
jgi:murein DD-endopeptidase MepM/ murein hydrolase activator NlpD